MVFTNRFFLSKFKHTRPLRSETLLHMNTVYRYRAVLQAHNGQESVNVTCPRHYREDLSDSIHMSLLLWAELRPW